jgi:hypothetical protein
MALQNPYLTRQITPTRNLYSGNADITQNQLLRNLATTTTTQPGTTPPTPGGQYIPGTSSTYGVTPGGQQLQADTEAYAYAHGSAPPAASSSSGGGGGGGGGGGLGPISFEGDPILARIRAMNAQNIAQAEASALAQRKRAEIGYGYDPNLQYEDPATAEASKQNSFSTLYNLLLNHTQRAHSLDENLNKSNLFWGSERANQVGLEGRQYTGEQLQQQGVLQNLMDQIAQGVLQTRLSAQQAEIQGESDAYNRALQFAIANSTGGGGGGGSGGGGGGGVSAADPTRGLPVSSDQAKYNANPDAYKAVVAAHPNWVWRNVNGTMVFGPP